MARIIFKMAGSYRDRTMKNASSSDVTIAFAKNFNTAGEKLTERAVKKYGKAYVPVKVTSLTIGSDDVQTVVSEINKLSSANIVLNIAGNGIYTFKNKFTQDEIDDFVYKFLRKVKQHPELTKKIDMIRSGGQTGFDEAGVKAAKRLQIDSLVLAPRGWMFRDIEGNDVSNEDQFKARFEEFDISNKLQVSLNGIIDLLKV